MVEARVAEALKPPEPPPEAHQPTTLVWLRRHLFNSAFNSAITVLLAGVVVVVLRGLLGFVLDEGRLWGVIPRNATNYAVEAYPRSELARIWASVVIVAVLAAASLATWRPRGGLGVWKIMAGIRSAGLAISVAGILSPTAFGARGALLVLGLVLVVGGLIAGRLVPKPGPKVPTMSTVGGIGLLVVAGLWLLPIDNGTARAWTGVFAAGVGAYVLTRAIRGKLDPKTLRLVLVTLWLLALPVIYLHIQRNPQIPVSQVTDWLGWLVPIVLVGLGLFEIVGRSSREKAGAINALVVIVAIGAWFVSAPMIARFALATLAILSLATPTFASTPGGRKGMRGVWVGAVIVLSYIFVLGVSAPGLATRNEYLGGLNLTFMLAIGAIGLSFPLGVALALGRTSTMPIFRLMSTGYIEVVRGVPLITVLYFVVFIIPNFLPANLRISANIVALGGMVAFSAAYLAENIRGGLQSIAAGQYEAAKALGMTTAQMTMLITLPQALRAVIPAIVGQVISLFKDTSLVAIVGLADFFRVARDIVPNQPQSLGSVLENLMFAAAVYWVFTFSFSRASLRLERKLGVGTR